MVLCHTIPQYVRGLKQLTRFKEFNTFIVKSQPKEVDFEDTKMTQPEKKIRVGNCTATVWNNEKVIDGQKMDFKSVSIDKNYKVGEDWKTTNSLNVTDIPKMILALQEAFKYVAMKEESKD